MFLIGARSCPGTVSAEQAGEAFARLADVLIRALLSRASRRLHCRARPRSRPGERRSWRSASSARREMTATLRPRPRSSSTISTPTSGVRRRASALRPAVLRAAHPAPDQRADRADQLRRALSGRHAAAAVRPLRSAGDPDRRLHRATRRREAWTWEHMALTRARVVCGSPAFTARVADGDPRRALPQARRARRRRRMSIEMRAAIATEKGDADPLGPQIRGRRAGRYRVHRPISAARSRRARCPTFSTPRRRACWTRPAQLGLLAAADADRTARRRCGSITISRRFSGSVCPALFDPKTASAGAARPPRPRRRSAGFPGTRGPCHGDAAPGARNASSDSRQGAWSRRIVLRLRASSGKERARLSRSLRLGYRRFERTVGLAPRAEAARDMRATGPRPMRWAVCAASAERQPPAQKEHETLVLSELGLW